MPAEGPAANMRAALFMMASMAGFALNDALVKSTADELGLFQAILLRGLVATALIALLALRSGALRPVAVGRRDRRLLGLRSLAEVGATVFFLGALFSMPLADATAILQSVPLAVALGAALFLREPMGWRRMAAIGVGFIGVLVILRPGAAGFDAHALLALAAVGFITLRDLVTRPLSPGIPSFRVTLLASAAITAAGAVGAVFGEWRPVAPAHLGVLSLSALFLIAGYHFGVLTMRAGAIAFTQAFRYTLLPWSIVFGILFFGEWPDGWMLAGSAIVIGTGLFTFYREQAAARARRAPGGAAGGGGKGPS